MDREWGSKPCGGGAASGQNEAIDRRERLRRLALETINLAKDPYFRKNHHGTYECKLCFTLHNNEGNYLAHTQGKKHQTNLAKRASLEAKKAPAKPQPQPNKRKSSSVRRTVKISKPGYKVWKKYDPKLKQRSLLSQIEYPEIEDNIKPRHRFMSSYEQKVEPHLLFAAEPYETISFKVPSTEIDKSNPNFFSHWDPDSKMFTLQVCFKPNKPTQSTVGPNGLPPPPPPPMPNGLWPIPQPPRPPIPNGLWPIPPPPPPAMPNGLWLISPPPPPPMPNGLWLIPQPPPRPMPNGLWPIPQPPPRPMPNGLWPIPQPPPRPMPNGLWPIPPPPPPAMPNGLWPIPQPPPPPMSPTASTTTNA